MSAVTSGSSRWPWSAKLSVLAAGAVALGFALHSREVSAPAAAAVGPPRVATPAPTPKPPARLTVQRPARPAAMRAPADTDLREAELLAALSAQPSVAETRRILHGLSRVGTPAALPAIAELAESGPLALRELAIASLGTLGGDEATAVLIGLTESEREPERVAAVQALGRAGTEPAADWLRELASADRSPLAHHAILALGDIGGADVEVELLRHLRDLDETRAVAASQALGVLGSPGRQRGALAVSAHRHARPGPRERGDEPRGLSERGGHGPAPLTGVRRRRRRGQRRRSGARLHRHRGERRGPAGPGVFGGKRQRADQPATP
jgi:hypothetical protein